MTGQQSLEQQQITLMQPARIHTAEGILDCELIQLSRTGAKLRLQGGLPVSQQVFLSIRDFGQLACSIAAGEGDILEVTFSGDPQVQDAIFQDFLDRFGDEEGRRRFLRRSVLWPGALEAGGKQHDCTILNMSLGGAKIAINEDLGLSGSVVLSADRFDGLLATIVWTSGRMLGLQFKDDPYQVAEVLGELLPAIKASA
ncbi:PilZ domain-containing protein [Pelagibius sp.]|uniref:PilZ domain-containing protein n=1 Tax=Pelagibius sp. TaxID=1931238 RepID=UPI003BB03E55